MEYKEFSGKSEEDAVISACEELGVTTDELEYEVVEKGATGFLGIGSKPTLIKAKKKNSEEEIAREFLSDVLGAMDIKAEFKIDVGEDDGQSTVSVDMIGEDMGILIGKRGQTLDALQYLLSLVINKESQSYHRVKLDTENYRARRKETLESLAKSIAIKVKRGRKPVALEPMNPYERRIIHYALQDDKYCTTKSEGDEPYRHVVVMLKD